MQTPDLDEKIKVYLAWTEIPITQENVSVIKDICEYREELEVEECLVNLYHKIRWEGTSYFFKYYTHAFDHWTKMDQARALEILRKVASRKMGTAFSLEEKSGYCRKCNQKLSISQELRLATMRYGDLANGLKGSIKKDIKKLANTGEYTCEKCVL